MMACLIIGVLGMFIVAGVVFSYIKDAPPLNAEELQVPLSTTILDRNGDVIAELGTQKRENIEYDEIPEVLENSVLATEDVRFFEHSGVDLKRIGGAVIANITEGFGAEGASTITQQVVKNAFLTPKKSIERKVQEQYLAFKLEQQYEKEEIFTMYLNMIPYGKDIYGVKKASEAFFGKSNLNELTLAESALLAGIPQRPNAYNPFINPELAEQRRNTVLNLMVQHDKISEQEAEEAKKIKVVDMIQENYESDIPYESFIERVLQETSEQLDDEVDVYSAGLTIHTTLDPNAQDRVEYLLSDESPAPFPDEKFQAGIAAIDTKTGEILAIGGGRNKEGIWGGMNFALNPNGRQPGSVIKPILDYGPAIEFEKWSTYHQINDEEITYEGSDKVINNFDHRYRGWVTMRHALYQSLNVPAVKTFNEIDTNQAVDFAQGLGIPYDQTVHQSDAIGGGDNNVNPLQLAGAFAAFGNGGIYNEPYAVTKIVYPEEEQVIEVNHDSSMAMSDYTAYMISDVLKDVIRHPLGTANSRVNVGNLPVAAKTGTTNRGDAAVDSWIAGYTTNYSIAVWGGYPEEDPIPNIGKSVPTTIFTDLITHMSQGVETADFAKPDSVVEVPVEEGTRPAKLPSDFTPNDEIITELFVKGTEPTETSEKYDQLNPVENLKADFNEDNSTIELTWEHPSLQQEEDQEEQPEIAFNLRASVNDSDMQQIATVQETELMFDQIEPGATYTFEITAVDTNNEENQSEPTTVTIETPDRESDFWDDFFDNERGNGRDNEEGNEDGENDEDGDPSNGDGPGEGDNQDPDNGLPVEDGDQSEDDPIDNPDEEGSNDETT